MEATLCLRTPYPSIKKLQCLLTIQGRNSTLRRCHHDLALTFSLPFDGGLRARPRLRLHPVVWAHMPSIEDDSSNRKVDGGQSRLIGAAARSAAAAAVLACALGAMCPSWKGKACAHSWPFTRHTTSDHGHTQTPSHEESIEGKSIKVLQEIFHSRSKFGVQKPVPTPAILLELLSEQLEVNKLSKEYLSRLKTSEKGDAATKSLYDEWCKKGQGPEKYELGLLLIDILLNQGDYQRAKTVCEKIEEMDPSKNDRRPKIRRAIIDVMLLTDFLGSEVEETKKTKKLKKDMDAKMLDLIKLIKQISENSPIPGTAPSITK